MANCILMQNGSIEKGNPYPQVENTLKLYWYGDECSDVTGGITYKLHANSDNATITKNTDNITLVSVNTQPCANPITLYTTNNVNVDGFTKLISYYDTKITATTSSSNTAFGNWSNVTTDNEFIMSDTSKLNGYVDGLPLDSKGRFDNLHYVTSSSSYTKANEFLSIPITITNGKLGFYQTTNYTGTRLETKIHCLFVTKDDDTTTLTTLASKCSSTATTIDGLLADSTKIFSSQDAVWYMLSNCTGEFMIQACQCVNFIDAMSASEYGWQVSANEVWNEYLTAFSPKKLILYYEGNECTEYTGGWITCAGSSGTIVKNDSYIDSGSHATAFTTTKPTDLTSYSVAHIRYKGNYGFQTGTTYNSGLGYNSSNGSVGWQNISISSASGNYYPFGWTYYSTNTQMYAIYLEK